MLDNIPYQGCIIEYDGKEWEVIQESTEYKNIWCIPKGTEFTEESGSTDLYKQLIDGTAKITEWPDIKPPKKPKETEQPATIEQAQAQKIQSKILNLKQALKDGPPHVKWIVKNIVAEGGLTFFAGPPGSYKSFLGKQMALSIATGKPFLEKFTTRQNNVLYIDEENGNVGLLSRMDMLIKGHEIDEPPDNLFVQIYEGLKLDNSKDVKILEMIIKNLDIKFVVLDSLVRMLEGNEDSSQDVRKLFDNIKHIMEENNVSFLALHHTRKDNQNNLNSIRGSGDFAAMADTIVIIQPRNDGTIKLKIDKTRWLDRSNLLPFQIQIIQNGPTDEIIRFQYMGVTENEQTRDERCFEDFTEWLLEGEITGFNSKDAMAFFAKKGHNRSAFYETLAKLKEENIVSTGTKPGNYIVHKSVLLDEKAKRVSVKQVERNSEIVEAYVKDSEIETTSEREGVSLSQSYKDETRNRPLIPKSSNLNNLKEYFKKQNEPTTKKDLEKIGFTKKVIDRGIPMLLRSGDIMESKPGEYRKT